MRISGQLLRSRAKKPLHSSEYIDLSSLDLERIERLASCTKLRTLILSGNKIDYISNLHVCSQLWRLDLSNNCIKSLEGLSRFVALGSLILSNNDITWSELAKIRHMHILDLCIHGNPQLEQDPYYRIHVVDCLPNVWMLDGRIVTSAERLQVMHFFQDSALTEHPVRHKCGKESFTPTQLKNIKVNGIFGEKTVHFMRRFPVNGALNVDTDRRRLKYLAYTIQDDLGLESKYEKRDLRGVCHNETFLEDVLAIRNHDREKANMLLLLLVASLEFALPIHLMKETLETTKLSIAVNVKTMDLFLLPRESRCAIVSLLLSAVKVDKDMGEEGGLYDKLYLCLYYSVAELIKLSQASDSATLKVDKKAQAMYADSRSLIGAEVVQLLCIVPAFFDYVTKDPGIMHLVSTATCDTAIVDKVRRLMHRMEKDEVDPQRICEEAADIILTSIQQNALNMINRSTSSAPPTPDILLHMKKPLPRRPQSSPIFASEFHAAGRPSPRKPSARGRKTPQVDISPLPSLGDQVLLGPQNVARIISIPETDIILVQMDVVPAETGAMVKNRRNPDEHYTYLDMRELYWDQIANYWRPKGTVGDRISITNVDPDETGLPDQPEFPTGSPSKADTVDHQSLIASLPSSPQPPTTPSRTTTPGLTINPVIVEEVPRAVSVQLKERLNLKLELSRNPSHNGQVGDNQSISPSTNRNVQTPEKAVDPRTLNVALEVTSIKPFTSNPPKENTEINGETYNDAAIPIIVQQPAEPTDPASEETKGPVLPESAFISIDIPQVPQDSESQGDLSTRSTYVPGNEKAIGSFSGRRPTGHASKDRSATARSSLNTPKAGAAAHTKFGIRPATADSGAYKMRVAKDTHYVSSYQAQRTEAWKNTRLSRPNSTVNVAQPSQPTSYSCQPPSSPASSTEEQSATSKCVSVCRGTNWLAGGRDLHWESLLTRPRTAHAPGWKEGLSPRPRSGAAVRALKRNKSPAIVTPSSMAYEFAYGRGTHQTVPELTQTEYAPPPVNQTIRSNVFPLSCMVIPLPPRKTPIRRPSTAPVFYGYQRQLYISSKAATCHCHQRRRTLSNSGTQNVQHQQHQCQDNQKEFFSETQPTHDMFEASQDAFLLPPNPGPSANNSFVEDPVTELGDAERFSESGNFQLDEGIISVTVCT